MPRCRFYSESGLWLFLLLKHQVFILARDVTVVMIEWWSYMASYANTNLSVFGAAGEKNRPADVYCVWFRYDHLLSHILALAQWYQ